MSVLRSIYGVRCILPRSIIITGQPLSTSSLASNYQKGIIQVQESLSNTLAVLNLITDQDYMHDHKHIPHGSVVYKGSIDEQIWKSIKPLGLLLSSFRHAIQENQNTLMIDVSTDFKKPMNSKVKKDMEKYIFSLRHDLNSLTTIAALDMDWVVRYPPRDPGGLVFDVPSTPHKEVAYIVRNHKHHHRIVMAMAKHMSYSIPDVQAD